MIAAVDTNILLDLLIPDERYRTSSKALLDYHHEAGRLVICDLVYAELSSQFPTKLETGDFFHRTRIQIQRVSEDALDQAGRMWRVYIYRKSTHRFCPSCGEPLENSCTRCKTPLLGRQHIISDFVIGAHAFIQADILLTRDKGFYWTYFKDLKIASPA
ncbi:MAG: type II toxin-antitoxin system VapC family toxin [Candidatus Aminicenantes bacterium]|nr:type II toxin-antitoxin system VapC family toxin [Candidatus Aminicenantes bacterium]